MHTTTCLDCQARPVARQEALRFERLPGVGVSIRDSALAEVAAARAPDAVTNSLVCLNPL